MSGHSERIYASSTESKARQAVLSIRHRAELVRLAGFDFYQAPKRAQDALGGLAGEMDRWADALEALLADSRSAE